MKFKLVPNKEEYYDFIRELRTCEDNKYGFIEQVEITLEEQRKYMLKYEKYYFICLLNNLPVGFVGVVNNDIRVATKSEFKRMGVAKFMINEIMKIFPEAKAKIKSDNLASVNLFKSCGFNLEFLIMKK